MNVKLIFSIIIMLGIVTLNAVEISPQMIEQFKKNPDLVKKYAGSTPTKSSSKQASSENSEVVQNNIKTALSEEAEKEAEKEAAIIEELERKEMMKELAGIVTLPTAKEKEVSRKMLQEMIDELHITKTQRLDPLKYNTELIALEEIRSAQLIYDNERDKTLTRYGISFFNNENNVSLSGISVPSYYLVNNSDVFSITMYGFKNEVLELEVDNNGNLNIPNIGPISVASQEFSVVSKKIENLLKKAYNNTQVYVNVTQYSTIQVSLTGFVNAPGVYNVSSMSTVKDLLIQADGVNKYGSIRNIKIYRDGKIYKRLDFYDLISGKTSKLNTLLKSNDSIHISKAKLLVKLRGEVYNPAIFELKKGEKLADLIEYSGGFKAEASKNSMLVKRYIKNSHRKAIEVDLKDVRNFRLYDADSVHIYSVSKEAQDEVYLFGNVVKPGSKELGKTKSILKFFKKMVEQDGLNKVFLENTSYEYALIKRIKDDLSTEVIGFCPQDVIDGKADIRLKRKDEIYIFNKLDYEVSPSVSISGSIVIKPGKHQYYDGLTAYDLINVSGKKDQYDKNYIKVTTRDKFTYMPKTVIMDFNQSKSYKLKPFDSIELYDYFLRNEKDTVSISGNVYSGSDYPYVENVSLQDLLQFSGGIKRNTFTEYVKVTRTIERNNEPSEVQYLYPSIKDAKTFILQKYDKVQVYNIEEKKEKKFVSITGAVKEAGKFDIGEKTTLKEIVLAAGGLDINANPNFCEIVRKTVTGLEVSTQIINVDLENEAANFKLHSEDVINVKIINGFNETRTVTLEGEVVYPGTYTVRKNEKLYDVIVRAGGFTDDAFLRGAFFSRESIRKIQREAIERKISRLKQTAVNFQLQPTDIGEQSIDIMAVMPIIEELNADFEKFAPLGRIALILDTDLEVFQKSNSNLTLESGDKLIIPTRNETVFVTGEVMNSTALIYFDDSYDNYIDAVGGYTQYADESSMFVVHADGSASECSDGFFFDSCQNIQKGDVIVVPKDIDTFSSMQIAKDVSQILYQFALTAASLSVLGVL